MAYSLTWLPQVLRSAGLKVGEVSGWLDRGRGDMGDVRGVMLHHTGTAGHANMPTLGVLINGRKGRKPLSGPLAQLGLARDGTYYVVAAGRANHAGEGAWRGISGNSRFIGIEAENSGSRQDPWPDVQMDAYVRGVAALLARIGASTDMCCAHREYAPGRKIDPIFDMSTFRDRVGSVRNGTAAVRPIIPAVAGDGRPTLRRGSRGEFVREVQKAIGAEEDGVFGPGTEAAVRKFQRDKALEVADGIVGPKTWALFPQS